MNVREEFGVRETKGDIGLEIELEGRNVRDIGAVVGWRMEDDGSLRNESVEMVLRKPEALDTLRRRIQDLNKAIKYEGAKILDTGRAGVHVHINVQELTMTQVYNMIVLYLIFEDQLTDLCGEYRDGNLFCLRASDAEYMLDLLRTVAAKFNWHALATDEVRYAALNVNSLARYGSVEFRAMRSTTDEDTLMAWAGILLRLREIAVTYDTPQDVIHAFSLETPRALYDKVFAAPYENLVPYDQRSMMEGMRRAQHIAFASTWDEKADWYDFQEKFTAAEIDVDKYRPAGAEEVKRAADNYEVYRQDRKWFQHLLDDICNRIALDAKPKKEVNDPYKAAIQRLRDMELQMEQVQPLIEGADDVWIRNFKIEDAR